MVACMHGEYLVQLGFITSDGGECLVCYTNFVAGKMELQAFC